MNIIIFKFKGQKYMDAYNKPAFNGSLMVIHGRCETGTYKLNCGVGESFRLFQKDGKHHPSTTCSGSFGIGSSKLRRVSV